VNNTLAVIARSEVTKQSSQVH